MITLTKLPAILRVYDYHEFESIQIWVKELGGRDICYKELGMEGSRYAAVFYETEQDISEIVKKWEDTYGE